MNDLNFVCFISNLITIALCGVLLCVMPFITRKTFLFGVRVPETAQEHLAAKALKRKYITLVLIATIGVFIVSALQFIAFPKLSILAIMYLPIFLVALQMIIFISCWKRALLLKRENNWNISASVFADSSSSYTRGGVSEVPWGYYIVSFIIIAVSIALTLSNYSSLPDQIVTHYDFNMNPTTWKEKSFWVVMMEPLISLSMLTLMAATAVMIVKAKLQVSTQNPSLSFAQHKQYRKWMGHGIGILTVAMIIGITLLSLMKVYPQLQMSFSITMAIFCIPVALFCIISVRIGQGGCKLNPKITEAPTPLQSTKDSTNSGDDKYWIAGMFYYNKEDPSLLVEDRFGFNIGFNYGHIVGKVLLVIMLAFIIGIYVWVTPLALTLV